MAFFLLNDWDITDCMMVYMTGWLNLVLSDLSDWYDEGE